MRESAKAKVNLFLHVGGRRADGFHELESLAVFAEAGDALAFEPADTLSLAIEGPFAAGLQDEPGNLILRAARALAANAGIEPRAKITLTKNLPIASGIGGGSADAAAALRGLCRLWNVSPPLNEIALSLGSDVPVCLESKSAWMMGRGEHIETVSLPRIPMVLVNPGVPVSTAEVFAHVKKRTGIGHARPGAINSAGELVAYLKTTTNDLQAPASEIAPVIEEALTALLNTGAQLARMSGSGATCFGIYESDADAAKAANAIAKAHAEWWIVGAKT
jgi:4-diphosphocytidyl-2-C-methyl-D-erythritol kinase